jgi:hypothetical protein
VEKFAGGLYELGPRQTGFAKRMPFLRLGVAGNPNPKQVTADDIDKLFTTLVNDFAAAQKTLDAIKDTNVKVPVDILSIQLDLNGDTAGGEEKLGPMLRRLRLVRDREEFPQEGLVVAFDYGDVCWLRGYTHLLTAISDLVLAYDKTEIVKSSGRFYFQKVKDGVVFPAQANPTYPLDPEIDVLDLIAFIHELRLPVKDAKRTDDARTQLLAVIDQSRQSWKAILAETEDDREWIPNPKQKSVLTDMEVTQETIDAWLAFLDDGQQLLEGQKLIPFWRSRDGKGINLKKLLDEPMPFDLVMWAQGSPFLGRLEDGKLVNSQSTERMFQLLGGNFFMFAAWVN